jgi:hypothetical protein
MLILLDLDGTLIHDHGYRAAIDATIIRYARQNDLPVYPPSDDDVYLLHAYGFSNEWDTVAFIAGILHQSHGVGQTERPDYQAWTQKTTDFSGLPNERAREALLRDSKEIIHPLIHSLLDDVTDVEHAVTTRLFAEIILGSQLFAQHYGLKPALNSTSLLETLDEPLINAHSRDIILARHACVFTARPSLPPGHGLAKRTVRSDAVPVHPPEAEIGLQLLHLEHLPMIALGHVQWLADQHSERVYDLTKPSPVQALAAFLAAKGIDERASLNAAYRLWKSNELGTEFQAINGEDIYILEDNAAGVRACHTAAGLLQQFGIKVKIHGIGIAKAAAKRNALAPVCDVIFDDVNDALAYLEDQLIGSDNGSQMLPC